MQCLQQVYISDDSYQSLFTLEERALINYSGVFSQNSSFEWRFEHNNFREFLAAEYLKQLDDIEEIKRIVSLSNGKIKESWVNTLSFLATLDTGDSLRDWLYICDPEMIVKLEN